MYDTAAYFVTSGWGTVFAIASLLVLAYVIFTFVRGIIRHTAEKIRRKDHRIEFQHELERIRTGSDRIYKQNPHDTQRDNDDA